MFNKLNLILSVSFSFLVIANSNATSIINDLEPEWDYELKNGLSWHSGSYSDHPLVIFENTVIEDKRIFLAAVGDVETSDGIHFDVCTFDGYDVGSDDIIMGYTCDKFYYDIDMNLVDNKVDATYAMITFDGIIDVEFPTSSPNMSGLMDIEVFFDCDSYSRPLYESKVFLGRVPEPSSVSLLFFGLFGIIGFTRKKNSN